MGSLYSRGDWCPGRIFVARFPRARSRARFAAPRRHGHRSAGADPARTATPLRARLWLRRRSGAAAGGPQQSTPGIRRDGRGRRRHRRCRCRRISRSPSMLVRPSVHNSSRSPAERSSTAVSGKSGLGHSCRAVPGCRPWRHGFWFVTAQIAERERQVVEPVGIERGHGLKGRAWGRPSAATSTCRHRPSRSATAAGIAGYRLLAFCGAAR